MIIRALQEVTYSTAQDERGQAMSIWGLPVCPYCGQPAATWTAVNLQRGYRDLTNERQYHCRQAWPSR